MSDWNADAADYLTELARRPAARQAATIGEIWDSEWQRSGLDTISGIGRPFNEAYGELQGAIEKHAGADLATLAYRNNVNLGAAVTPELRIQALNAIADTLPADAQKELEPLRDVRRRAADKAQQIERDAADVSGATYGLSGNATAVLAGIARQSVDPSNLAANLVTAPIGGTFTGPVLKVIARQAAAGGLAQLLVEPQIQEGRAGYGLESGVAHGAVDVAQAAIGAGGLAGLLRASGAAFRMMRSPRVAAPAAEAAPNFEPTFVGYLDHESAAALDRGEFVAPKIEPHSLSAIPDVPGFSGTFDIGEGAQARPTRTRAPATPETRSDFAPDFVSAEDAAAFDRGDAVQIVENLGAHAPELPGSFSIGEGARARPTREGLPAGPPRPPRRSEFAPDFIGPDDVAAFDRGQPQTTPHTLDALADTPWRGFDGISVADLEAAARLAERDQFIDAAAPPHWDRGTHHAMVDEAAAALEAGRPIDRALAADRLEEAGLKRPAVVPAEVNPIAAAAERAKPRRFGVHNMQPEKQSLFQFLASIGGMHPEDKIARDVFGALHGEALDRGGMTGELQHILDGNPFVPGFGQLLRKTGLTLERARMAAAEQGYLSDRSTIREFLDLVREEAGGNKQYRDGFAPEPRRDRAAERDQRASHRAELATEFDARLRQLEISKITKRDRTRALQIMEKEGQPDPLLAYEQALAEYATRKEAIRAKRIETENTIPGWDVPDDAGAAPKPGADVPGQSGDRPGGPGPGGEPRPGGEGARAAEQEGQLGDPALKADADRALEARPELEVAITDPDGATRTGKPAEMLREAQAQASAAGELFDCAGVSVRNPELSPIAGTRLKAFARPEGGA